MIGEDRRRLFMIIADGNDFVVLTSLDITSILRLAFQITRYFSMNVFQSLSSLNVDNTKL